jgi:hypothetical protein
MDSSVAKRHPSDQLRKTLFQEWWMAFLPAKQRVPENCLAKVAKTVVVERNRRNLQFPPIL